MRVLRRGPSSFPTGLSAFELGLALLPEGGDPFVRVLGHEDSSDRFALNRQPKVQRPTQAQRDRELRMSDGDAWPGGEFRRVLDRARTARGGIGKQLVYDADLLRVGRLERGGVGDEVECLRLTDQARQALGSTRPREKAEVHLWEPDLIRALGGEPQVACQRELQGAPKAVARDGARAGMRPAVRRRGLVSDR